MRAAVILLTSQLLTGLSLAGPAAAEGGRLAINCTASQTCDIAGDCTALALDYDFVFAPSQVDADGLGFFDLTYQGLTAYAEATEDMAFHWSEPEGDRMNLMFTSQTTAILVFRRFGLPDMTRFQPLDCEALP